jgi:hypothetical protein
LTLTAPIGLALLVALATGESDLQGPISSQHWTCLILLSSDQFSDPLSRKDFSGAQIRTYGTLACCVIVHYCIVELYCYISKSPFYTVHSWAPKTFVGYHGDLRRFYRLCDQFQISHPHHHFLPTAPPHGENILHLWSMEHCTLQASCHATQDFVGYAGARSLCLALGSVNAWALSLGPAGSTYRAKNRLYSPDRVSPMDDLLVSMTLVGMS